MQTPLLFSLFYHLVDGETKAGLAQDITIQLLLSCGCHRYTLVRYTLVTFFPIKDNIAQRI